MSVLFKQMSGRLGHRAGCGRWALSMRLSLPGGGWLAGSVRGQRLGASQPHWVGDRFDTAWHLTYSCPLIRPPHWHKGSWEELFCARRDEEKPEKQCRDKSVLLSMLVYGDEVHWCGDLKFSPCISSWCLLACFSYLAFLMMLRFFFCHSVHNIQYISQHPRRISNDTNGFMHCKHAWTKTLGKEWLIGAIVRGCSGKLQQL